MVKEFIRADWLSVWEPKRVGRQRICPLGNGEKEALCCGASSSTAWGTVNIRGQLDKPKRLPEESVPKFEPDAFFDPTGLLQDP
jgi:hypothetical protein